MSTKGNKSNPFVNESGFFYTPAFGNSPLTKNTKK